MRVLLLILSLLVLSCNTPTYVQDRQEYPYNSPMVIPGTHKDGVNYVVTLELQHNKRHHRLTDGQINYMIETSVLMEGREFPHTHYKQYVEELYVKGTRHFHPYIRVVKVVYKSGEISQFMGS